MFRVLLISCVVFSATAVSARPPYRQALKRVYGNRLPRTMQTCSTCHLTRQQSDEPAEFDETAPPHNAFGLRLIELAEERDTPGSAVDIAVRLEQAGPEDADGDSISNDVEILSGHAPGDATDRPSAAVVESVMGHVAQLTRMRTGYRWSPFTAVQQPQLTVSPEDQWSLTPIDLFITQEHLSRQLAPRPVATRPILLRRVSLDLLGLPPSPASLHRFLDDPAPDAYERVVDRFLASPQYGERWGRHWMDVWRYSDWAGWTGGKQIRDSQPHIWRWRDWIVESLNADKPYDRMLTEMLAADELWPTDPDTLRATGFLARNYKKLSREVWMQDTVQHTLQAFTGLTVGCARCHDHMYDPISQEEYYRLRAIFEPHNVRLERVPGQADTALDGIARVFDAELTATTYLFRKGDDRDPDKEHVITPGVLEILGDIPYEVQPVALPPAAYYPALRPHVQQQLLDAVRQKIAQAKKAADTMPEALAALQAELHSVETRIVADAARYTGPRTPQVVKLATLAAKAEREAAFASAVAAVAVATAKRDVARAALKSGDAKQKKTLADAEQVLKQTLAKREVAATALSESKASYTPLTPVYPERSSGRRSALARWLTHPDHPLTARVAVNQIWMRHFGQPLVPTVLDFGQNGEPPTHPALLDWLAAEWLRPRNASPSSPGVWAMKRLHRLIVTSQTYRMASTPDTDNLRVDPDNRWLWRVASRRMEAEVVRDGILFVSGNLDLRQGGPDIDHALGFSVRRRSLYFRHAQEKQMEFLKMFDCAAVSECYQRKESIVPQQALALVNSEITFRQARKIARRLHTPAGSDQVRFATAAFEQVLSRPPTSDEILVSVGFLTQQRDLLAATGSKLAATGGALSDLSKPSGDPSLRSRENFVHVLLNHNDFVTIR
ncbi:MAG: multidrug transporter [Planctomycetaceae bacterium]|nr:multidrug transporter [Planctomycetaceae bacterium]